jgi:glycosyltransferase involved in cell wall biosynthesis
MRIGMLLHNRFPPDIRVENEIRVLQTEHNLYLLCPRYDAQNSVEAWNGTRVQRVFSTPTRRWENFRMLAIRRSPRWQRKIGRFVADNEIEVLHVHDLPLLGEALKVGRRFDIPVVADLHENYPAMLGQQARVPRHQSGSSLLWLFRRLFVSVARWQSHEADVAPQADAVIVVIEEARERVISLGVRPDRVHVVANYVPLSELNRMVAASSLGQPTQADRFGVTYVGGFGSSRDLHTVIDAAALLRDKIPELRVTLVGGTAQQVAVLQGHAARKGVSDQVEVLSWVPFEQVIAHIATSTVCLVPHAKSPHTDATIPHKLFQYMALERPVIVSNCAPLVRIVGEAGAGLVYSAGNASELAECVRRMCDDPALRDRMARHGRQAVQDRYNWEQAGKVLVQLYREIGEGKRRQHGAGGRGQ